MSSMIEELEANNREMALQRLEIARLRNHLAMLLHRLHLSDSGVLSRSLSLYPD